MKLNFMTIQQIFELLDFANPYKPNYKPYD